MKNWESLWRGLLRVELCGAEPERLLNDCAGEEIRLMRAQSLDAFTLRVFLWERDYARLAALAERRGCTLRVLSQRGGSRSRTLLRRRAGLLAALGATVLLLFFSSLFVWEIRVTGGEGLALGPVINTLEDCGLRSGVFWPTLDVDALRDRALTELPELAWLTVNLRGSVAELKLLPRAEKPEIYRENEPTELRAARPGLVRSVSALAGEARVFPGRFVETGELLVAGESLSREGTRLLCARGEVVADTWYEIGAVCPVDGEKESVGRVKNRFALQIGEKRVNFYWNRTKAIDGCDKIVHEYNIGIEGLFRLPVRIVREELRPYESGAAGEARRAALAEEIQLRLLETLRARIEGEIISLRFRSEERDGLLYVTLFAQCRENIAESRPVGGRIEETE